MFRFSVNLLLKSYSLAYESAGDIGTMIHCETKSGAAFFKIYGKYLIDELNNKDYFIVNDD